MDDEPDHDLIRRGLLPVGSAGPAAELFVDMAHEPDVDRFRGALVGLELGLAVHHQVVARSRAADHLEAQIDLGSRGIGPPDIGRDLESTARSLLVYGGIPCPIVGTDGFLALGTRSATAALARDAATAATAVPIGLAFGDDLDRLRAAAARHGVSHNASPVRPAGTVLHTYAVARLTRTLRADLDPRRFLGELRSMLDGFGAANPVAATDWRSSRVPARLGELERLLDEPRPGPHPTDPVLAPLVHTLWLLLTLGDDPERALAAAAHLEPGAPHVATLTGSLLGAYHGDHRLPTDELDPDRVQRLRQLGEELHHRFVGGVSIRHRSAWPPRPLGTLVAAVELDEPVPPIEPPFPQRHLQPLAGDWGR